MTGAERAERGLRDDLARLETDLHRLTDARAFDRQLGSHRVESGGD